MKVVANTTPLISLASIGKLELLKGIFGEIIIADAVFTASFYHLKVPPDKLVNFAVCLKK